MVILEIRQGSTNQHRQVGAARSELLRQDYVPVSGIGWFITDSREDKAAVDELWIRRDSPYLEKWHERKAEMKSHKRFRNSE
jgi:hypothetical protein